MSRVDTVPASEAWRTAGKRILSRVLRQRLVNAALRRGLWTLRGAIPLELLSRVPVVGTVTAPLPSGAVMKLCSDGRDVIASSLYWGGLAAYEPGTLAVWGRIVRDAKVVLDVGANCGIFALYAALEARGTSVHAFEPVPRSVASLERNIAENGTANITPHAAAVCDHDGVIELFIPPGETLPLGASTSKGHRKAGTSLEVEAVRLDTVAARLGLQAVDVIKLDTEGTEPAVLAGARGLLARDEPMIVCEVLHGLTETRLHAELDPLGYRYFWIRADGIEERPRIVGDPAYRDRNWLLATTRRLETVPGLLA